MNLVVLDVHGEAQLVLGDRVAAGPVPGPPSARAAETRPR